MSSDTADRTLRLVYRSARNPHHGVLKYISETSFKTVFFFLLNNHASIADSFKRGGDMFRWVLRFVLVTSQQTFASAVIIKKKRIVIYEL